MSDTALATLRDGELRDLMPYDWAARADVTAYSGALARITRRLMDYADTTRLLADIDTLPEHLLDHAAVQERSPYYDQDLPAATKRDILKRTLVWHIRAGTPSAVTELLNVVLGDGQVVEWFDFGDYDSNPQPYTFDIETVAPLQPDTRSKLLNMLDRVKNVRSHLRTLRYERKPVQPLHIGHSAVSIRRHHTDGGPMDTARYTSAPLTAISSLVIPRRSTAVPRRQTRSTCAACALSVQVIRRRIVR